MGSGCLWLHVAALPHSHPILLPLKHGCSGLSGRALPPNDGRSHSRSWHAWLVMRPVRASWALLLPLNLSLKTPSLVWPVPITRRCFAPTPAFPPPPPPGQDVPTWLRMPGWAGRGHVHTGLQRGRTP